MAAPTPPEKAPRPPWGLGEQSAPFPTVGVALALFSFYWARLGGGVGSCDSKRGLIRPEAGGSARGKGVLEYAPQLQKAAALFLPSFPDVWTPGVPLTLHFPSLDSALGLN